MENPIAGKFESLNLSEVPYGRNRRIEWIEKHLTRINPGAVGGGGVAEVYRVMGILGEHLDGCDADMGGMSGLYDLTDLNEAYVAYHNAQTRLVAALNTNTYIEQIEATLLGAAAEAGIDTSERRDTLWYLGGSHRRGEHSVELATYLTARQIGTRWDNYAMHRSYIPPTYVRAELLARTPAWVVEYARKCDPAAAHECSKGYAITDTVCDYVRGLWKGEGEQLERVIAAAKRLARGKTERSLR